MKFEEKVPRKGQKILMRTAVIVGVIVLGGAWIYLDSGKVEEAPIMVEYLRKYAGWKIDKIAQQKTKKGDYTTLDTYYDLDGRYKMHYICTNRPGMKINDNKIGCVYKFDGNEKEWRGDFFAYFMDRDKDEIARLKAKYPEVVKQGAGSNIDLVSTNKTKLKSFLREYLELPDRMDFYKVCRGRMKEKDYSEEHELGCDVNTLRVDVDLRAGRSGVSLLEWGVKNNMELER